MFRTAAILISAIGFAIPAIAQEKEPRLPDNSVNCKQFKKTGSQEWTEIGTAVFDLGKIKDIHLNDQPVTPRFFSFGGIDLYPVLEQKCGAVAYFNRGNVAQAKGDYGSAVVHYNEALRLDPKLVSARIQRVFALERLPKHSTAEAELEQSAAVLKTELEQDKSELIPAQTPLQANINEAVPTNENKLVKPEGASCGDRKAVYVADGFSGTEGSRSFIEIAFNNKILDKNSDFLIRKYTNNNLDWSYKGKNIQGHLVFTEVNSKEKNHFMNFTFTSTHSSGKKPVMLMLNFVKPNRDGTGEAILYLSGLRALFASKDNVHRFKFEGKRPSEFLPEAFYFDRCE